MKKEIKGKVKNSKKKANKKDLEMYCKNRSSTHGEGFAYGLGFIGATWYYISTATSFGAGVVGILKALVWPAFLVYEIFKFLGM